MRDTVSPVKKYTTRAYANGNIMKNGSSARVLAKKYTQTRYMPEKCSFRIQGADLEMSL